MNNCNTCSDHQSLGGGFIAALVVFALTWFVVNGAELPRDDVGVLNTRNAALCVVSTDKPTSRFSNSMRLSAAPGRSGNGAQAPSTSPRPRRTPSFAASSTGVAL